MGPCAWPIDTEREGLRTKAMMVTSHIRLRIIDNPEIDARVDGFAKPSEDSLEDRVKRACAIVCFILRCEVSIDRCSTSWPSDDTRSPFTGVISQLIRDPDRLWVRVLRPRRYRGQRSLYSQRFFKNRKERSTHHHRGSFIVSSVVTLFISGS